MIKALMFVCAMLALACVASFAEDVKTKNVDFEKGEEKHSMALPEAWTASKPEGMRQLEVLVPKKGDDKEDGEIAVFIMKMAGGVARNLERWTKSMGGAEAKKTDVKTAGGKAATIIEIEGTYTGMNKTNGQPLDAKENSKLLGAIFEEDGVYIKFTGPKATVEANKSAFEKMIQSYK